MENRGEAFSKIAQKLKSAAENRVLDNENILPPNKGTLKNVVDACLAEIKKPTTETVLTNSSNNMRRGR